MDISKLAHGTKLVLGAAIAFLIVSIFKWQEVEFEGITSVGQNMWHGWGVLAGLLAIAIIALEIMALAGMKIEVGVSPAMRTAGLAILLLLFTVLKFLADNEFRTFWAWLGLLIAVALAAVSVKNMQAAGESLGEMGAVVKGAASSAAASAKAATERSDTGESAPAAPAAPEAPAAPSAPAAPEAPAAPDEPAAEDRPAS